MFKQGQEVGYWQDKGKRNSRWICRTRFGTCAEGRMKNEFGPGGYKTDVEDDEDSPVLYKFLDISMFPSNRIK